MKSKREKNPNSGCSGYLGPLRPLRARNRRKQFRWYLEQPQSTKKRLTGTRPIPLIYTASFSPIGWLNVELAPCEGSTSNEKELATGLMQAGMTRSRFNKVAHLKELLIFCCACQPGLRAQHCSLRCFASGKARESQACRGRCSRCTSLNTSESVQ